LQPIQKLIDEFMDYLMVELNRSPVTCRGYRVDLGIFTTFIEAQGLGCAAPEDLTPELLGQYLRYLTRDRGNQANTLRRRVTALKSFFNFLVDSEYLEKNPAENLPSPKRPQKHPRHLQREEIEKLFSIAGKTDTAAGLRDKTALMFIYYTGVRVSELVHIHRDDLDLEKGFVKIVKGKGGRFRQVPLHARLTEQVQQYLAGAPELAQGHLFCNRQGRQISADYIHHILAECAVKAGLEKKVTPHMLRHSFATHLYREEVDINTLGKLLGHAGIRTTSIYTHTDLKHLREGVERLNISSKLETLLFDGAEN